jgi:mono/diheme cytochrome c family protein
VVAGLAVWAALSSAPLGPEATSDNLAGFKAKSEWYVSPLHGLIFLPPFNQARFEPVATAVLPTLAVGLLAALPFLARREGSKLRRRGFVVSLAAAGAVGSGALAVYGGAMDRTAVLQPSADSRPPVDRKLVVAGVKLYDKLGCAGCHKINGVGGTICPDLSDEGKIRPDRQWQIDHLINPSSKVPGSTMPAYPDLKRHEVAALAEYMVSLFKKKPGQAAQR